MKKTSVDAPYILEPLRQFAVPIGTLVLDPSNARKHDERNLEAISASLLSYGQRTPLVVQRSGRIVRSGNGRLLAARALGWEFIAALIVDDADADAVAFAIADNRTAELASWDFDVLAGHIAALKVEDYQIEAIGFSEEELNTLLAIPKWEGVGDTDVSGGPPLDFTPTIRLRVEKSEDIDAVRAALAEFCAASWGTGVRVL